MITIHHVLFIAHIVLGSAALLLFWLPLIAKKGGIKHIQFGRYYEYVMYGVAMTGALMASIVLYDPILIKGSIIQASTDQEAAIAYIRSFWTFLLYLSLLTMTSVRHAILVLRYKKQRESLRNFSHLSLVFGLFAGGIAIMISAILSRDTLMTLFIVFGLLGTAVSANMIRYIYVKSVGAQEWLLQHIGSIIGSGIGAYTAFLAFGGRQFLGLLEYWQQMAFWIAPGIIGGIAISWLSRKYQHRKPVAE